MFLCSSTLNLHDVFFVVEPLQGRDDSRRLVDLAYTVSGSFQTTSTPPGQTEGDERHLCCVVQNETAKKLTLTSGGDGHTSKAVSVAVGRKSMEN